MSFFPPLIHLANKVGYEKWGWLDWIPRLLSPNPPPAHTHIHQLQVSAVLGLKEDLDPQFNLADKSYGNELWGKKVALDERGGWIGSGGRGAPHLPQEHLVLPVLLPLAPLSLYYWGASSDYEGFLVKREYHAGGGGGCSMYAQRQK